MRVNSITVENEGYVYCKSRFYSAQDILPNSSKWKFFTGINKLSGDIDSGVWAISYMLSMYKYRPEDFILFEEPIAVVNNKKVSLSDVSEISCYMDRLHPLFSNDISVRELIVQGLTYSHSNYSPNDIKDLFFIDSERFERSLASVGNECFRVMAAIGYAYGKRLFCFPWLSQRRVESYRQNISALLPILERLGRIVILPVGIGKIID